MIEHENALNKVAWKTETIGQNAITSTRPIDPEIMAKMPKTSKTFVNRTLVEVFSYDVRNFLYEVELLIKGNITSTPPPKI